MNGKGAQRWMHHMRGALLNYHKTKPFDDPRVMPCIVDFIKTKMKVYAKEHHNWKFDESDFDFANSLVDKSSRTSAAARVRMVMDSKGAAPPFHV